MNGKKYGIEKRYYESGALEREVPYKNGKKHGIEKTYYESGVLQLETPYVNGKMHGIKRGYDKEKTGIYCLTLYKRNRGVLVL